MMQWDMKTKKMSTIQMVIPLFFDVLLSSSLADFVPYDLHIVMQKVHNFVFVLY